MELKLLGSFLIFAASVGFAFRFGMDLKEHLQLLYEIRKLILDIANEASFSMLSVETILREEIHSKNEILNEICQSAADALEKKETKSGIEIWNHMIEVYQKKLHLSQEEKEIFQGVGNAFFGKSIEENEKGLNHYVERLDFLIETVRAEQKEKKKVYQTASVMCGLIVILLLL